MGARRRNTSSDAQLSFEVTHWLTIEKPVGWTDGNITRIRSKLLTTTVREIADRRNAKAIATEAWNWILSDDIHPFSFLVCCESEDLDALKMRESLVSLYRTLMRRNLAVKVDIEELDNVA